MATSSLRESSSVALDASGNGTIKLGPQSARETWHPANVHVGVTTNTLEAICNIYIGDAPTAANFRDGSFSGSSGDMCSGLVDAVAKGWFVYAVWSGGDAGSIATMTITGTKDI